MNLRELAETLGLSQTTVSRALNGYPEVAKATRERVIAAANAAHYRPSGQAVSLATGRTKTIGHVIPVSTKHEMVNPVFGDFIAGASEIYAERGYQMLLSLVADDDELQVYRDLHARGQVDGIVVHAPQMADRRLALLDALDLPFVVHGRASQSTHPYSWVDVPNTRAFEEATAHLISLGHRRIALINGLEAMDFAYRRRKGFEAALANAHIAPRAEWMSSADMTEQNGYDAARRMLSDASAPTAFVVASVISALGVKRAVHDAGLTLGRHISVITFDDALSYLRNDTGGDGAIFTAIQSSVRDAGRRVAAMLLDRVQDPGRPPDTHMMETTFVPGRSTGPAP